MPEHITHSEFIETVASQEWFEKNNYSEVLLRYYSFPAHDGKEIDFMPQLGKDIIFLGEPYRLCICDIADQHYFSFSYRYVSSVTGPQLITEKIPRKLPNSTYVLASTPIRTSFAQEGFDPDIERMNQFIGLLRMISGNALFKELVREEVLAYPTNNLRAVSPILSLPAPVEGPFLRSEHWIDIQKIMDVSSSLPADIKQRLTLSLNLFEQASNHIATSKLFLYWVAIEVLCGTNKTSKIKKKLCQAYKKDMSYIQNQLGLEKLIHMRQELFHQGKPHDLPQDVERYIQLVFFELVREVLSLPCVHAIEEFLKAGFSVKRLEHENGRRVVQNVDISTI